MNTSLYTVSWKAIMRRMDILSMGICVDWSVYIWRELVMNIFHSFIRSGFVCVFNGFIHAWHSRTVVARMHFLPWGVPSVQTMLAKLYRPYTFCLFLSVFGRGIQILLLVLISIICNRNIKMRRISYGSRCNLDSKAYTLRLQYKP